MQGATHAPWRRHRYRRIELHTGWPKQVRFWEVLGDRLTITTPQIVNPLTGKRSVFRLTFQKVAPAS